MIRGIGTSKGIGMGRALIVESPQMEISVKKIEDTAAEQERYKKAKAQFIEETQQMIEQLKQRLGEKDKTALILHNQIYLINDAGNGQRHFTDDTGAEGLRGSGS